MKLFIFSLGILFCAQAFADPAQVTGVEPELEDDVAKPDVIKTLTHDGVYFIEPKDGATVPPTFKVKFGVRGMEVQPAGKLVPGTGHHHLIIDNKKVQVNRGMQEEKVIPADDTHLHFGKGQTETEITLKPGKHVLTMQFADGAHRSYGPDWAATITVHVKPEQALNKKSKKKKGKKN